MNTINDERRYGGFLLLLVTAILIVATSAAHADSVLYVSDDFNIARVTSGGVVSLFATFEPGFDIPVGLAFDMSGNLFTSLVNEDQIDEIAPNGVVTEFASLPTGSGPTGLAFDASGNLLGPGRK